ncbi:MAG: hypothetical protein SOT70_06770 [Lachnospiraceae bacterium]|nr:hypothetical protein [Lachnospiraceae bacterium]
MVKNNNYEEEAFASFSFLKKAQKKAFLVAIICYNVISGLLSIGELRLSAMKGASGWTGLQNIFRR